MRGKQNPSPGLCLQSSQGSIRESEQSVQFIPALPQLPPDTGDLARSTHGLGAQLQVQQMVSGLVASHRV